MRKGFTLLELIVVIVILGILATLGYTQYTRMVERGRFAEAVANLGKMRTLAIAYYLQNGTFATITAADVGIGAAGGSDLPGSCDTSHYFWYAIYDPTNTTVEVQADRCCTGLQSNGVGKTPQWPYDLYQHSWRINGVNYSTARRCWSPGNGCVQAGWPNGSID